MPMWRFMAMSLIGLLPANALATAPDAHWNEICSTISHYAQLLTAARDKPEPTASAMVLTIMGHPSVMTPDVVAEVNRQVYRSKSLPVQEAAAIFQKCMTPVENNTADSPPTSSAPLVPIKLQTGHTLVATDQGDFDLTLLWEDEGHGHGRDVFTASMQGQRVLMPNGDGSISDDPADDRNMRRSIRFAQQRQNNHANYLLLLVAEREPGPGATTTSYSVYYLTRGDDSYKFLPLIQRQLPTKYCNADAALTVASGLPSRESYRGPPTADGCPVLTELTETTRK